MASGLFGISGYQQYSNINKTIKGIKTDDYVNNPEWQKNVKDASSSTTPKVDTSKVETKQWSPLASTSSLIPTSHEEYGMTIGEAKLSDTAKDYYNTLKSKFGNSSFILVSNDMKDQVKQNAAAYGNVDKMVVLIDEEKLEMMANDESYRKKYEGIIAMSEGLMKEAKNGLTASGAAVKNFGMSVDSDGKTSFFATLKDSSDYQTKITEKRAEAKKEAKIKEKKAEAKKEREERLEKIRDKNRTDEISEDDETSVGEEEKYVEIDADSLDSLIDLVSKYAYDSSASSVMTESEKVVGQHFDFRG